MIPVSNKPQDRGAMFGGAGLGPIGALFCVLFCIAAALVLDYGVLVPSFVVSTRSPLDFKARVFFKYSDPEEVSRIQEEISQRAPHVYAEDRDWVENIMHDIERLAAIVEKANSPGEAKDQANAEKLGEHSMLLEEMYRHKSAGLGRMLDSIRETLRGMSTRNAVLSVDDFSIETNRPAPLTAPGEPPKERRLVRVKIDGKEVTETTIEARNYLSLGEAFKTLRNGSWTNDSPSFELTSRITRYLESKLKPALHLDKVRTKALESAQIKQIGETEVNVLPEEKILEQGQVIRAPALVKLRHELVAYKASQTWRERLMHLLGLAALAGAVMAIFLIVAARVLPGLWERRRGLVMLGLFTLGTLAICRALVLNGFSLAYAPLIVLSMTAALAFGQAVAVLTLMGVSVLSAFTTITWEFVPLFGGTAFISTALFAGAVAAAIPAERLNTRIDLLRYGVRGGMLQGVLAAAMTLLAGAPVAFALQWPPNSVPTITDALVMFANGPVCGLVLLGALPLIESLFKILTNIRLYELADFNQPALRRIQMEAPGTFAHTLQVRFLAEPAADAIGANTRLVSAGVLYHDLGKTMKPEYYVENTFEAEERHKRLKPSVSALLIISHVKDGIDLAHDYGLPQQIIDFIPEHHGTTLVSYFYHSAKKEAEKDADDKGGDDAPVQVDEAFFRYPGPKPRSREAAIVMLADTVEAATRTLNNPSSSRLKEFVHDRIMDKLLDNQLDECSLTFAELALVEEAFIRVLTTRFHSRIRYPGQEEEDEARRTESAGEELDEKDGEKGRRGDAA